MANLVSCVLTFKKLVRFLDDLKSTGQNKLGVG